MPPVEKCKTCKICDADDGQIRCRPCHTKFREWLDGGPGIVPQWNGVISDPTDSYPDSSLHRALLLQAHRRRGTLGS